MDALASGEAEPALLEETIGANFQRIAAEHAARDALVEVASGRRWTYQELDADVDALARGLMAVGIGSGDRVGIWAPNCAEWTMTQYATAKAGAILVNINPAYRTHELAYVLNQAGVTTLIAARSFKTSDYRAMVEEVREQTALERVVYIGEESWGELLGAATGNEDLAGRMASWRRATRSTSSTRRARRGFPRARR
jgi:fatty-acyl-CoA synthase